jgi:hypothetical protein
VNEPSAIEHTQLAHRVEQNAGADHMRAREHVLVGDRAVHVRLGREVHDGLHATGHLHHEVAVLDAAHHQLRAVRDVLATAGVGELVEHHHLVRVREQPHVGRADETGSARHEQLHARTPR